VEAKNPQDLTSANSRAWKIGGVDSNPGLMAGEPGALTTGTDLSYCSNSEVEQIQSSSVLLLRPATD
jgi:hypothetical protein